GIDMPVGQKDVQPTVVLNVHKAASPAQVARVLAQTGRQCGVDEIPISGARVKAGGVVREVGFEDVEPAVGVVVAGGSAHAGLFLAVFVVGATGLHGNVGEGAILVVAEQKTGCGITGDIDIGPAVVVEITGQRGERIVP